MALLTGLSCAELFSKFPKAEAEYNYVTNAFNARLAFVIGLLVLVSGFLTAATVALGFAGYFSALTSFPMIFFFLLYPAVLALGVVLTRLGMGFMFITGFCASRSA
jgi:APA family basic amino acid/polyamine antiporter